MTIGIRNTVQDTASERAGTVTLLLAILALAATAFTYVLSLSDVLDPPTWVRAAALVWLPIGISGAPIAYTVARTGGGRRRGEVGLGVAAVALTAFVVLLSVAG